MDSTEIINEVKKKVKIQQVVSEFKEFLDIVQTIKPKVMVEIGSYRGGSAACFSHLTETLISIDVANRIFSISAIKDNCNYHFIEGDSHSGSCKDALKNILKSTSVDILFIDGDHTYSGAKKDFALYKDLVRPGGIIALHDIKNSKYHLKLNCRVYKLWDEIKNEYEHTEIIRNSKWGGIGVIKIP